MNFSSIDEITTILRASNDRVFLVAHTTRIGIQSLCSAIEWYWYKPGTERNRLYDVYGVKWGGMVWVIAAFPSGRLDAVKRLAARIGLRVSDSAPVKLGGDKSVINMIVSARIAILTEYKSSGVPMDFFPGALLDTGADNMAVHAVENDTHNPVYNNRRNDDERMLNADGEVCTLLNQGVRLTPDEIAGRIYGLD